MSPATRRKPKREQKPKPPEPVRAVSGARVVAIDALVRIDDGAYAHVVLPAMLSQTTLSDRPRVHHRPRLRHRARPAPAR